MALQECGQGGDLDELRGGQVASIKSVPLTLPPPYTRMRFDDSLETEENR